MVFRLDVLPVINWLPKHWLDQLDIDLDDWESKKYLGFIWMALQHYRWRESASYLQFYALSRVMERAAVSLARVIHIAAEEDAAAFTRIHPRAKLNIAPNQIAPLTSDSSNSCPTKAEALLFVGNLRYLPNSDAIYWAIQKMLPRLRQTHPNVTLYVVGDASADLAQFLGNAPVKWAGRLDDLSDIYAQSTIAIAPLRGGSGTKFKILEAWLYRRAVVATTHAARGLGIVPGVHALVADTVEDFVSACQQLLDDEGLRNKIANAGHQLVHEKFVL
jgi:glycosyltransferase involved in cell wall biosynthesis